MLAERDDAEHPFQLHLLFAVDVATTIIIFLRPEHIMSDLPPPPYVDMSAKPILLRVLTKEVLREAFQALDMFDPSRVDSVHGEFGSAEVWNQSAVPGDVVREQVKNWIHTNRDRISHICDVLLHAADPQLRRKRKEIIKFMLHGLLPEIDKIVENPEFTQEQLSERLANAGLLPMFGFPTRVRYLFHKRPQHGAKWPPEDVVDRPLDLAISQFAPGSETVKEGLVHTATGVVRYQPQGIRVAEMPNPLGSRHPIGICKRCQAIDTTNPPRLTCPVCEATDEYRTINLSQPAGFSTLFDTARDYDGVFEWTPRAGRPKISMRPLEKPTVRANFEVWRGA